MEIKTFKELVNRLLVSNGFSRKGSFYFLYFKEITIVIGLQKSNFAKGYYINIGYIITALNTSLVKPKGFDGDVRARFNIVENDKIVDLFDLEVLTEMDTVKVMEQLEKNIIQYIVPVSSLEGLKALLKITPVMLYQTKLEAKQLLGFE